MCFHFSILSIREPLYLSSSRERANEVIAQPSPFDAHAPPWCTWLEACQRAWRKEAGEGNRSAFAAEEVIVGSRDALPQGALRDWESGGVSRDRPWWNEIAAERQFEQWSILHYWWGEGNFSLFVLCWVANKDGGATRKFRRTTRGGLWPARRARRLNVAIKFNIITLSREWTWK